MKNIVICLDGTSNEVKAKAVTNVFKIVELLDLQDPDRQRVYYDPGVGTLPAPGAWSGVAKRVSVLAGLALGRGIRQNIAEAYTYLMRTWEPGDQIFVFGFSRGAYTARALCGLLRTVGLLRPGSENLVPYAIRVYARNPRDADLSGAEGWDRINRFAGALALQTPGATVSCPVRYLGVFDTVKATSFIGPDFKWPWTRRLANVQTVRHAVSIDERRRPYQPYLLTFPPAGQAYPQMEEVWFAGIHSDIGGGFPDNPELGDISMRWVLDGAVDAGLHIRDDEYARRYTLVESDARVPISRMSWGGRLAGAAPIGSRRAVPADAVMHGSVGIRCDADDAYRRCLPESVTFLDRGAWTGVPGDRPAAVGVP
ncbi:DUF2235 domain-containing protein [Mycobacterium sp. AMU20-3851]|uniref:DUF2235 domain-containing protein n=1 Tax=Mycobacterium sp. AMU20-3851 TaxID=3122055 RepID=UPI0037542237